MSELIKSASPRRRSAIVVTIAALLIASAALLPETAGLTYEGRMVLSILAAGVLLWVTEALPLAATALLVLVVMPITGVCSFTRCHHHPYACLRIGFALGRKRQSQGCPGLYVCMRVAVARDERCRCMWRLYFRGETLIGAQRD